MPVCISTCWVPLNLDTHEVPRLLWPHFSLSSHQLPVGSGDRQAESDLYQPHWRLHVPGSVPRHEHLHLWSLWLSGQAVGREGRRLQADLLWTHQWHQCHCCEKQINPNTWQFRAQLFKSHETNIVCVSTVQFFNSGNAVITGSDDCSCKMYDLRADQEVIGYQDTSLNAGVTSLALSSSGRLIFAGYDDFNCHIWDSLKGEKVGEWDAGTSGRLPRNISSADTQSVVWLLCLIPILLSPLLCPLLSFALFSHICLLPFHFLIRWNVPFLFCPFTLSYTSNLLYCLLQLFTSSFLSHFSHIHFLSPFPSFCPFTPSLFHFVFAICASTQPPSFSYHSTSFFHSYHVSHFLSPLFNNLPSFSLSSFPSPLRCAVWPRQQGELHRCPRGWHGCVHRLLGQLPQTVELKHLIWSGENKHEERRRRIERGGARDGMGE